MQGAGGWGEGCFSQGLRIASVLLNMTHTLPPNIIHQHLFSSFLLFEVAYFKSSKFHFSFIHVEMDGNVSSLNKTSSSREKKIKCVQDFSSLYVCV